MKITKKDDGGKMPPNPRLRWTAADQKGRLCGGFNERYSWYGNFAPPCPVRGPRGGGPSLCPILLIFIIRVWTHVHACFYRVKIHNTRSVQTNRTVTPRPSKSLIILLHLPISWVVGGSARDGDNEGVNRFRRLTGWIFLKTGRNRAVLPRQRAMHHHLMFER